MMLMFHAMPVILWCVLFALVSQVAAMDANLLLSLVNAERSKADVGALCLDRLLTLAAQTQSEFQAAQNVISHIGAGGSSFVQRIEAEGFVGWKSAGENVASGQADETAVVNAWMNSPEHRANILNAAYTFMGIAEVNKFWTQDFASGGPGKCTEVGTVNLSLSAPIRAVTPSSKVAANLVDAAKKAKTAAAPQKAPQDAASSQTNLQQKSELHIQAQVELENQQSSQAAQTSTSTTSTSLTSTTSTSSASTASTSSASTTSTSSTSTSVDTSSATTSTATLTSSNQVTTLALDAALDSSPITTADSVSIVDTSSTSTDPNPTLSMSIVTQSPPTSTATPTGQGFEAVYYAFIDGKLEAVNIASLLASEHLVLHEPTPTATPSLTAPAVTPTVFVFVDAENRPTATSTLISTETTGSSSD